jgi:amino acid transporter
VFARLRGLLIGGSGNHFDPRVPHNLARVALLAWIGLSADGLSSSSYGPEAAWLALGGHVRLALLLAAALVVTIFLISATYRHVMELFPTGGGGYLAATRFLGPGAGIVSGGALLADYVLTIALSIAAGVDAIFSFLPVEWQPMKPGAQALALLLLTGLNLRGVRAPGLVLIGIAGAFLATHVGLVLYGLVHAAGATPAALAHAAGGAGRAAVDLGALALAGLFLRSFSLGAVTWGGLEAASNGLPRLPEPRVRNGQRTLLATAAGLAFLAGGLLVCFALHTARPEPGRTLDATLWNLLAGGWRLAGTPVGPAIVTLTLLAEAGLLLVAVQAGFVGGPRMLAAMAVDQWMPKRMALLSERLVIQYGVLTMGLAAALALVWTGGGVRELLVMYAISVLATFTLSQLAMARHWWMQRERRRRRRLAVAAGGATVTAVALGTLAVTRFHEGGWEVLLAIGLLTGFSFAVRSHYRRVRGMLRSLDDVLGNLPLEEHGTAPELVQDGPTGIVLVEGYNGLGIHTLLTIQRMFPRHYRNLVFCSVGIVDAGPFKSVHDAAALEARVRADLEKYVALAQRMGVYAEYRYTLGTEVVSELEAMCLDITREFRRCVAFAGQLVFQRENLFTRSFHHETAFSIQRRLQFRGVQVVILPIRVWDHVQAA